MSHPLAVVLFDVDGTLVESERDGHRVAFNLAFEAAGMTDRWGVDEYGQLLAVAGGKARIVHHLTSAGTPHDEATEVAARLHAHKTATFVGMVADGHVPPRPGAVRLVREIAAAGLRVGITTTGSREWVAPLVADLFGDDVPIALMLTGTEVPDRKPSPAIYQRAIAELEVPPGAVVVVEDSDNGLRAAVGAGLATLMVVNDYSRAGVMADPSGAALVVDGFGDPGEAAVLRGSEGLLHDGAVTLATLRALLASAA